MATRTSDRAHMRDDLRELARQASSPRAIPSSGRAFKSADSSGYVDLSEFSATDDGWVDRELARAKGGAMLGPGSLRPISMDALLEVEPEPSSSRTRTWVVSGLGLAGAAAVAFLAVTLSKHAPPAAARQVAEATTVVAPPATTAAPAPPPVATAVAVTASVPIAPVVIASPDPATASKKHAGGRHPASAPAHVAMARPAPSPRPAVIPAAKGGGSGDSLMDAIKASVTKK
jgi:hypothetical protein